MISLLLTHLPLLKPGNIEAKVEYMKLLPKILAHSIEHNQHIEESRQLLSYALIHPATSLEDRSALAMWLNHLEDRTSGTFGGQSRGRSDSLDYGQSHYYHQRQNSDDKLNGWQSSRDSGICVNASSWQDKNLGCENGHLPLYSSSSVPATINTIGTSSGTSKSVRWVACLVTRWKHCTKEGLLLLGTPPPKAANKPAPVGKRSSPVPALRKGQAPGRRVLGPGGTGIQSKGPREKVHRPKQGQTLQQQKSVKRVERG